MPTMPAAAKPSKIARSSAKAICLAASLTGCQSESLAPRSTSSTACPVDRERHPQLDDRRDLAAARPHAVGRRVERAQVPGADGGQRQAVRAERRRPPGGAATCRVKVRRASASRSAQAASEIGASSRCRLFRCRAPLQTADAAATVVGTARGRGPARAGRVGRRRSRRADGLAGGGGRAAREVVEEVGGRHEEQGAGDRGGEVEDAVVVAGRVADEHVAQHLLGDRRACRVADEVGAELARAERGRTACCRAGSAAPCRPSSTIVFSATCELAGLTSSGSSMSSSLVRPITRSCSSTGSAFQASRSCRYFCTIDVAAAGEVRVLVADQRGRDARPRAGRVLGAVDEAQQVALVEVLEAVHLVDARWPRRRSRSHQLRGQLEAQVHPPGADVEQQVARRGRRRCAGRRRARRNGCSSAGRGPPNSRSQASEPMPTTQVSCPSGTRKPTERGQPGEVGRAGRGRRPRRPASTVTTRKIAASVSGLSTGCGSAGSVGHGATPSLSAAPGAPGGVAVPVDGSGDRGPRAAGRHGCLSTRPPRPAGATTGATEPAEGTDAAFPDPGDAADAASICVRLRRSASACGRPRSASVGRGVSRRRSASVGVGRLSRRRARSPARTAAGRRGARCAASARRGPSAASRRSRSAAPTGRVGRAARRAGRRSGRRGGSCASSRRTTGSPAARSWWRGRW